MLAQGLAAQFTADQMAVVGFTEVFRKLPFLMGTMRKVLRHIERLRPERIILIDYPGFNLRLAKRLAGSGIPVTYYISPQLWAWREGRIKIIRRHVDQMLVIFPFEEQWYLERGVTATFVGHPILDEAPPEMDRGAFLTSLGLDPGRPVITLYPGSRKDEVNRHLAVFHEAAQMVRQSKPEAQLLLGLAPGMDAERIPPAWRPELHIAAQHPRLALRYADVALIASGTATLEAAVWGVPQVVVYRMSAFSAWLGRRLAKLPHYSMVNILAGKELAPEFLQDRAQAGPIAKSLLAYLDQAQLRESLFADLATLRESLRGTGPAPEIGGGASARAARQILG